MATPGAGARSPPPSTEGDPELNLDDSGDLSMGQEGDLSVMSGEISADFDESAAVSASLNPTPKQSPPQAIPPPPSGAPNPSAASAAAAAIAAADTYMRALEPGPAPPADDDDEYEDDDEHEQEEDEDEHDETTMERDDYNMAALHTPAATPPQSHLTNPNQLSIVTTSNPTSNRGSRDSTPPLDDDELPDQSPTPLAGEGAFASNAKSERVHVVIRIRPLQETEKELPRSVKVLSNTAPSTLSDGDGLGGQVAIKTRDKKGWLTFKFDQACPETASQSSVFAFIRPAIAQVVSGVNTTVFAYGQTSTGKTHTMLGEGLEQQVSNKALAWNQIKNHMHKNQDGWGVIPRSLKELFASLKRIGGSSFGERKGSVFDRKSIVAGSPSHNSGGGGEKFSVMCSYMQIYNDQLYDLLNEEKDKRGNLKSLTIRESTSVSGTKSLYVQGLSEYRVSTTEDVLELLYQGGRSRAVRATEFNEQSSRSHAILQLSVELELLQTDGRVVMRKAKLNLVDLAGSEKWGTGEKDKDTKKELVKINSSLAALGNCISALANKSRKHIPYRDSPLTRLLQDSLGGGTRTIVIATVTPHPESQEESASTLQFANRATRVNAKITVNEVVNDAILLKRAQREISRLKEKLASAMTMDNQSSAASGTPPLQPPKSSDKQSSSSNALNQSMTQQDLNKLNAIAGNPPPEQSSGGNEQRFAVLEERFEKREADLLKEIDSLRSMVLGIVDESPDKRRGSSSTDIAINKNEVVGAFKEEVQELKESKQQMESIIFEMRNHMREMESRVSQSDLMTAGLIEKMQKGQMDQQQLEKEMAALMRIKGDVEFEQKMAASQDRLAALGVVSPSRRNRQQAAPTMSVDEVVGDGAIARVMQNLSGDAKELLFAHAATQQQQENQHVMSPGGGRGGAQSPSYYVPKAPAYSHDELRSPPKNLRLRSEDIAGVSEQEEEVEELFDYDGAGPGVDGGARKEAPPLP
ncbi:hypothetical protein TeGR_g13622, partial [Tetraparma gracilis]